MDDGGMFSDEEGGTEAIQQKHEQKQESNAQEQKQETETIDSSHGSSSLFADLPSASSQGQGKSCFLSDVLAESTQTNGTHKAEAVTSNVSTKPQRSSFRPSSLMRKLVPPKTYSTSTASVPSGGNSSARETVKITESRSAVQHQPASRVDNANDSNKSKEGTLLEQVTINRAAPSATKSYKLKAEDQDHIWLVDNEYDPLKPNNYEVVLDRREYERVKLLQRAMLDRQIIKQEEKRQKLEDKRREEAVEQARKMPQSTGMGRGRSLLIPAWMKSQGRNDPISK